MQTPNTARGRVTDAKMFEWRKNNPDASSSTYNREWERVYKELSEEEARRLDTSLPDLWAGCYEEDTCSEGSVLPPPRLSRKKWLKQTKQKHKPTKGAFGKCKNK